MFFFEYRRRARTMAFIFYLLQTERSILVFFLPEKDAGSFLLPDISLFLSYFFFLEPCVCYSRSSTADIYDDRRAGVRRKSTTTSTSSSYIARRQLLILFPPFFFFSKFFTSLVSLPLLFVCFFVRSLLSSSDAIFEAKASEAAGGRAGGIF